MAGLFISSPRPGFVTIPIPSPPSMSIIPAMPVRDRSTMISAPWVTSGSSPPSLTTEHLAWSDPYVQEFMGIDMLLPLGSSMSTPDTFCWPSIANSAALAAAVAELPVV